MPGFVSVTHPSISAPLIQRPRVVHHSGEVVAPDVGPTHVNTQPAPVPTDIAPVESVELLPITSQALYTRQQLKSSVARALSHAPTHQQAETQTGVRMSSHSRDEAGGHTDCRRAKATAREDARAGDS
jgi:hypothetical protein